MIQFLLTRNAQVYCTWGFLLLCFIAVGLYVARSVRKELL